MQIACSPECLGAVAEAFTGKQVQVLVLRDADIVELAIAKTLRDEESCSAPVKQGVEATVKEQILKLFGFGSVPKGSVAPPAAVASTSGVQEAAGAGALGGAPGEATHPAASTRVSEGAGAGAAGGSPGALAGSGDASPCHGTACVQRERSNARAGGQEEPDLASPAVGPHLLAAGGAGPGGEGAAAEESKSLASEGVGSGVVFGAFAGDPQEAALAPEEGQEEGGAGAGAGHTTTLEEVAPVEAVKTFALDVLDEGISTEGEEVAAQQAAPAAGLRTLSDKDKEELKKQRKLLDVERSLRRPGWEKDPDTVPLEVPNAEHQRAGLEWIWEQLVARAKDHRARFPEEWD
ncbi:unnamed protein product [Prorocentrum cordatum]|uniref:Uncharacterized protein n=1 Tax=Prorocentrum cordatum TaxID=2364126 RepID=A0ABN9TPX4_9DINO|nr:unnamed protein product [Polarella glacialis]